MSAAVESHLALNNTSYTFRPGVCVCMLVCVLLRAILEDWAVWSEQGPVCVLHTQAPSQPSTSCGSWQFGIGRLVCACVHACVCECVGVHARPLRRLLKTLVLNIWVSEQHRYHLLLWDICGPKVRCLLLSQFIWRFTISSGSYHLCCLFQVHRFILLTYLYHGFNMSYMISCSVLLIICLNNGRNVLTLSSFFDVNKPIGAVNIVICAFVLLLSLLVWNKLC